MSLLILKGSYKSVRKLWRSLGFINNETYSYQTRNTALK